MYICTECGDIFDEPKYWEERHGFNYGLFEQWSGCPACGGYYVKAYECDECGEYIDGPYIKTDNGKRICENCYRIMDLGDEDD